MSLNLEWPGSPEAEVLLRRLLAEKFTQKALVAIADALGISIATGIQSTTDLADSIYQLSTPQQRVLLVKHVMGHAGGPKPRRLPSLDRAVTRLRALCTVTANEEKSSQVPSSPTAPVGTPSTSTGITLPKQTTAAETSGMPEGSYPQVSELDPTRPVPDAPAAAQSANTPIQERKSLKEWAESHPITVVITVFVAGFSAATGLLGIVHGPDRDELSRYRTLLGASPEQVKGRLDALPSPGASTKDLEELARFRALGVSPEEMASGVSTKFLDIVVQWRKTASGRELAQLVRWSDQFEPRATGRALASGFVARVRSSLVLYFQREGIQEAQCFS